MVQDFRGSIELKIGCGAKVKLWEDGWLTDGKSLAEKYPRIYNISQQQQNSIQHMGIATAGGWEWCLQWRRLFREVEVDTVAKFMEDIQAVTVQVNQQDSWGWRLEPCGVYTVTLGSAYKVLASQLSEDKFDEVFKQVWKLKIPSKVSHFIWRLIWERDYQQRLI